MGFIFRLNGLTSLVNQVRAVMSSDDVISPFIATSRSAPAGFSICRPNNMTHSVTWSISNYLMRLQVDSNAAESFPFNEFTTCPDLNVPLYLGGVKGQHFLLLSMSTVIVDLLRQIQCVNVHRNTSKFNQNF